MEVTVIKSEKTATGYNEALTEVLLTAQAVERARDQVADVLMKVKRDYPAWKLPSSVAQSRPA